MYIYMYMCKFNEKDVSFLFLGEWLYESSAMAFPSGDRASK